MKIYTQLKQILMISILFIFVVSCAKKEEKVVTSWDDIRTASWEELTKMAKEEGQVSWFVWYYQPEFRELVSSFEEKYGIKVTIPEGTSDGNTNKVISEQGREIGSVDVLALGPDSLLWQNPEASFIESFSLLPDNKFRKDAVGGVMTNGYGVAYWGNQTGFAYNSDRINEDALPQSMNDLESWMQENPLSFAFNDPNGGGAGLALIRSVVRQTVPNTDYTSETFTTENIDWTNSWKWFKKYEDFYSITSSNADSLTRLNDGEFILTPAWEDQLASLMRQGALSSNIKFYIPSMGMLGSGNFSAVLKNASHPAAALLFLEWLSSPETQTLMNSRFGSAPQNSQADDSNSLIPNDMRSYSTAAFPSEYELMLKKQFISEILINQ